MAHYFPANKMSAPSGSGRLILQSDWDRALKEQDGKAWVTFSRLGLPNAYGELKAEALSSGGIPYVTASDNLNVRHVTRKTISLTYSHDGCSLTRKFMAPHVSYSTIHKPMKQVVSLDVTPGGLAVSADSDCKLKVWESKTGDIRRDLSGHKGDVYTCQFFPSGVVILSGGADMQLKIWSAETGQCAATLTGHKGGVLDSAIVDRGRNVVSCSRDGTAKLWDCGQATCLTTVQDCGGIVNGCALDNTANDIQLGSSQPEISEREVNTEGKMLLLACENKTLQAYGLRNRDKIFELDCHDAVNCCTFTSPVTAVCGTQDGHITVIDLRNYRVPLKEWKEQRSGILSIHPYKQGFFTSTGDGSCFLMNEELRTELELTGPDCDPVYRVVTDRSSVYTACRDGTVRRYLLSTT